MRGPVLDWIARRLLSVRDPGPGKGKFVTAVAEDWRKRAPG